MCHAFCSHLQEYIRREVKPKTKQELQAFSSFGAPLTQRNVGYIHRLKTVPPKRIMYICADIQCRKWWEGKGSHVHSHTPKKWRALYYHSINHKQNINTQNFVAKHKKDNSSKGLHTKVVYSTVIKDSSNVCTHTRNGSVHYWYYMFVKIGCRC